VPKYKSGEEGRGGKTDFKGLWERVVTQKKKIKGSGHNEREGGSRPFKRPFFIIKHGKKSEGKGISKKNIERKKIRNEEKDAVTCLRKSRLGDSGKRSNKKKKKREKALES